MRCFKLFFIGFFGFGIVFTASSLATAQPSEQQRVEPICNPNWVVEVPAPGSRVAKLSTGSEYRVLCPQG